MADDTVGPPEIQNDSEQPGYRFSFPYGISLIIFPVMAVFSGAGAGKWWGYPVQLLYLVLVGFFFREAVSRKQFEKVHHRDESLNRLTWVLNWGLFFVAWPLVLFGFFVLPAVVGN